MNRYLVCSQPACLLGFSALCISSSHIFHYAKYTFSNGGKGKRTYIFKISYSIKLYSCVSVFN
nr:MAG TPA: hypothetical protein [Caudoviricetes sp.]